MLSKVKAWLHQKGYKFESTPSLNPENKDAATITVCIDNMTALKCGEFFIQLHQWVAEGADNAEHLVIDGVYHVTFECPLDSSYELTVIIDGVRHQVHTGTDINEARGIMLDRFLHTRNNPKYTHKTSESINLNDAQIQFADEDLIIRRYRWQIKRRTVPFCG